MCGERLVGQPAFLLQFSAIVVVSFDVCRMVV